MIDEKNSSLQEDETPLSHQETETEQPEQNKETQENLYAQIAEYKDKYIRLLADTENVRKRAQKEQQQTILYAIENTICEFIPVIDNFEQALKYVKNAAPEIQQWATGFQMILSQFRDILHEHGIIAYHSEGNQFDPHFHEATEILETQDHPDGIIVEEFAKGYKSTHRVLRPAHVKVAKNTLLSDSPQEEQDK